MINVHRYPMFDSNMSTLKESSKDDSNPMNIVYMTEDTREVVDFDDVKTDYTNSFGLTEEAAKSVDALYDCSNKDVFIEFKNGNMSSEKKKVKEKVRTSLLIFGDITGKTVSYTRDNAEFVLVYNEDKNSDSERARKSSVQESSSRDMIATAVHQYADKEYIRFGMEIFKGMFFKDVHTYTKKEFEKYLLGLM